MTIGYSPSNKHHRFLFHITLQRVTSFSRKQLFGSLARVQGTKNKLVSIIERFQNINITMTITNTATITFKRSYFTHHTPTVLGLYLPVTGLLCSHRLTPLSVPDLP